METTFDLLADHVALKARVAALEELVQALHAAIETLTAATREATKEFKEAQRMCDDVSEALSMGEEVERETFSVDPNELEGTKDP